MKSIAKRTIKSVYTWQGIGVHSGKKTSVTARPVSSDSGIVLIDKQSGERIVVGKVIPDAALHASVLRNKSNTFVVSTIEHILAALFVLGIDCVELVIDGGEVPILDGSALPFVYGLQAAGVVELDRIVREWVTPMMPTSFSDTQGRLINIEPDLNGQLYVDYSAIFEHPLIGAWQYQGLVAEETFVASILPARTFGFVEDLTRLRKAGLACGASLGNSLVFSAEEAINKERFDNECGKHKLLDFIGDMALLGKRLAGRITAVKTGHSFNRRVIESFIVQQDLWQVYSLNG